MVTSPLARTAWARPSMDFSVDTNAPSWDIRTNLLRREEEEYSKFGAYSNEQILVDYINTIDFSFPSLLSSLPLLFSPPFRLSLPLEGVSPSPCLVLNALSSYTTALATLSSRQPLLPPPFYECRRESSCRLCGGSAGPEPRPVRSVR